MAIPVVALMMISLGIITRMVRTSVLEVLNQEYVTALRAKGLMPLKVVIHVIKNAAPPVVTVVGLDIGYLLGGSILVESVVNWPGAGGLVNYAIQQRDITLIQGTVLILSSFFVIINVIVDFLNTVIDPRIRRT
jgi:peptide/nickel transport system permease protein